MKPITIIIAYSAWSMLIGFLGWLVCNLNDVVINYWSIVLAVNCIYLLAAPIVSAVTKE
jgi:hypothetical protein